MGELVAGAVTAAVAGKCSMCDLGVVLTAQSLDGVTRGERVWPAQRSVILKGLSPMAAGK